MELVLAFPIIENSTPMFSVHPLDCMGRWTTIQTSALSEPTIRGTDAGRLQPSLTKLVLIEVSGVDSASPR